MMKFLTVLLAVTIAVVFIGSAKAVPPGKTVEFAGGGEGKVIFDGRVHADKGLKCNRCHTKIFRMKIGADKITMADINAGKFCGECHNSANCGTCHIGASPALVEAPAPAPAPATAPTIGEVQDSVAVIEGEYHGKNPAGQGVLTINGQFYIINSMPWPPFNVPYGSMIDIEAKNLRNDNRDSYSDFISWGPKMQSQINIINNANAQNNRLAFQSSQGGISDRQAGNACGTLCGSFLFIIIAFFILNIAILVWVAKDAKNRGMGSSVGWILLVFFTGIIGLIIYLFSRSSGELVYCEVCKNKKLNVAKVCPHCGNAATLVDVKADLSSGTQFCRKCGAKVAAGASFCENCGGKINAD